MKERLIEDWLIKINERGYEVAFCQTLISKGYRVIRCGHSPIEHGKDILAISPNDTVYAYQLKTGDFSQADITKNLSQLNMLVETRPIHPGLPVEFDYQPALVTTGEFKVPAISLVKELNASWNNRKLASLELINGRQLHVELLALSSDFWPVEAPAIRRFRELYLVVGKGDLDLDQFAKFLTEILSESKSGLDLDRKVSAANIFANYLLDEFLRQKDHWSLFQGWTICAAQIARLGESSNLPEKHWRESFDIAKSAALASLADLGNEILLQDAFKVYERELDDLTRTRNTIAVASAACWQLLASTSVGFDLEKYRNTMSICSDLIQQGRLYVWGEGAISQFIMIFWLLEYAGMFENANLLLMSLIDGLAERNARGSSDYFSDPYITADDCLARMFDETESVSKHVTQSYSLFPLILIAVRRGLRGQLEKAWPKISNVELAWFEPEKPADELRWKCAEGREVLTAFNQPQSWKELGEFAHRDRSNFLPKVIQKDLTFGLIFLLAFPHRFSARVIKHLDSMITHGRN